jgi:hypothetical protein
MELHAVVVENALAVNAFPVIVPSYVILAHPMLHAAHLVSCVAHPVSRVTNVWILRLTRLTVVDVAKDARHHCRLAAMVYANVQCLMLAKTVMTHANVAMA